MGVASLAPTGSNKRATSQLACRAPTLGSSGPLRHEAFLSLWACADLLAVAAQDVEDGLSG